MTLITVKEEFFFKDCAFQILNLLSLFFDNLLCLYLSCLNVFVLNVVVFVKQYCKILNNNRICSL